MPLTLADVQKVEEILVKNNNKAWHVAPYEDGFCVEVAYPKWLIPEMLKYWLERGLYGRPDKYRSLVIVFDVPYSEELERQVKTWAQSSSG